MIHVEENRQYYVVRIYMIHEGIMARSYVYIYLCTTDSRVVSECIPFDRETIIVTFYRLISYHERAYYI